MALSEIRPPPLLLRGEEEERPGVEEKKRLWVQTKMDPCFYKMILYKVASMAEVWCRLECPALLFPLPLAWHLREQ